MKDKLYEHINMIDVLNEQIMAILDLMCSANDCVDIKSINMAAEMASTILMDLISEVDGIKEDYDKLSVTEKIENISGAVCDKLCKYRDTCNINNECLWIQSGNKCPLDEL